MRDSGRNVDGELKSVFADAWVELGALAVSVAIGALVYFRVIPVAEEAKAESAVTLAFCLFAAVLLFRLWLRAAIGEQIARGNREQLKRLSEAVERVILEYPTTRGEMQIHRILESLSKQDEWFRRAGTKTVNRYLSHLNPTNDNQGFTIDRQYLALLAYSNFWEELALRQERNKTEKLSVRVTHSSSPDVWKNAQAKSALQSQARFVASGGVIVRIFLDGSAEPPKDYTEAMEEMKRLNIQVFYMPNTHASDLTSDFLWVSPYLVTWQAANNRKFVTACTIECPREAQVDKLRDQWCSVVAPEILTRYSEISSETAHILNTF
jgi:hypothetical protein